MVSHVGWENWGKMSRSRGVMDRARVNRHKDTDHQCLTYLQVQSFGQNLTFSNKQICLACQTGSLP